MTIQEWVAKSKRVEEERPRGEHWHAGDAAAVREAAIRECATWMRMWAGAWPTGKQAADAMLSALLPGKPADIAAAQLDGGGK